MAVKRWNGSAWEIYSGSAAADPTTMSTSLILAAGDLVVGTGSGTVARLAVGTSGQGLVSNGTTTLWGNPVPATHVASHAAGAADELRGRLVINSQAGTTYTVNLTDEGMQHLLTFSSSSAVTLTVPTYASVAFPVGAQISLAQLGTGQVTVSAASGVTVVATPGLKLRTQGSAATLINVAQNSWLLVGDLAA